MSSSPKKRRFNNENKGKNQKKFNYRPRKKSYLEAGQTGFLTTCNFRVNCCIREAYNLLNTYGDELYGEENPQSNNDGAVKEGSEEEDISDTLLKEAAQENAKMEKKQEKRRFQCVDTGADNFLFIRTIAPVDPLQLGKRIVEDISEKKLKKTQFLMRLVPIEAVCHLSDIKNVAGQLFDKHFLKKGSSFAVAFNKRFNNVLNRDDTIRELAELVKTKHIDNRVNLTNPEKTVVVEVLKGLCLLAVIDDYNKYRKYNLSELSLGPKIFTPKVRNIKNSSPSTEKPEVDEAEKQNSENGNDKQDENQDSETKENSEPNDKQEETKEDEEETKSGEEKAE